MKRTEGGVTAARGFQAAGVEASVKYANRKDMALIYSTVPCVAAGTFTTNVVKAAPVLWDRKIVEESPFVQAVVVNSGIANACTGKAGMDCCEAESRCAGEALGIPADSVLVASTGVIGEILPIEPIESHIGALAKGLSASGNLEAAKAIMTTDTVKKEAAVEFELDGKICRVGGMAKGSGMICPNMATTLNFITTDACISADMLQQALSEIVRVTYNCLSIDGDTSTNDMVLLLANGRAENAEIRKEGEAYRKWKEALYLVMLHLTKMLAKDGEGATKLLECRVEGAPDSETARIVAKSVISSPLFKCAVFGEDANWGRVLCAIGYAKADFEIDKTYVSIASKNGKVEVCRDGAGIPFSEQEAKKVLSADEITVWVDLGQGEEKGRAFGCDLTYDYVKINGDYRS